MSEVDETPPPQDALFDIGDSTSPFIVVNVYFESDQNVTEFLKVTSSNLDTRGVTLWYRP